ncbi:hypothetical protein Pnap_1495 [Polaromonas naphthalenivorans CJ2]|uniref:Uncharacterized protein n=1 Tax=Polaromonas naphthalenivorans (strain CJ2) TaxID=365044 RepID=A1VMD1_POLNA|nr:hypothetical protein Pnap_1495 [Polaromonas naphthalenivorans CJ2]
MAVSLPMEPVEPVDGLVDGLVEEDPGVVLVVSAAFLHPASASAAARASATAIPVFSVGACISVFLFKMGAADCQPQANLWVHRPLVA